MKISTSPNINYLWGALIIEELARHGLDYFCISPGSRSAPLIVPLSANQKTKKNIHYDERGTAYHALGYASASDKPAVLISTSGTAAANFLPAVIEASKKKLPLIVLTADRPPELRKTGADQTIEQVGLYRDYVRWQYDLPCPDVAIKPEFVLTTIGQAVYRSQGDPQGPVHINCMFREPLAPIKEKTNFEGYTRGITRWANGKRPYTTYIKPAEILAKSQVQEIVSELKKIQNGIIAVGKLKDSATQQAVLSLSKKLNWPVFPDISSGLRLGNSDRNVIHYYDQLLLSEKLRKQNKPDGVLHLGGRMTSKRWYQFIEQAAPSRYIMINHHPLRNDPLHNVSLRIQSSVKNFCASTLPALEQAKEKNTVALFRKLSKTADKSIVSFLRKHKALTEPAIARLISKNIPSETGLFLSSSLPVREMDMYACHDKNTVILGANRGASGIDGIIASAAGFAAALNKPTTLFIGDLAFLHDLNSLAMVRHLKKPMVIVISNNDGGGIFSFLPIAGFKESYEEYFGTPHGFSFESSAKMYGLKYQKPGTITAFTNAYTEALTSKASTIIEVITDRSKNYAIYQDMQKSIKNSIEKNI